MNNSHHKFTNKPCKPHPLDNKVWKLQDIPIIIEEPIPTDESEQINLKDKRFIKDPRFAQMTNSFIINNYSIRSVSQSSFQKVESDQFSSYFNQNWNAFELPSAIN